MIKINIKNRLLYIVNIWYLLFKNIYIFIYINIINKQLIKMILIINNKIKIKQLTFF